MCINIWGGVVKRPPYIYRSNRIEDINTHTLKAHTLNENLIEIEIANETAILEFGTAVLFVC